MSKRFGLYLSVGNPDHKGSQTDSIKICLFKKVKQLNHYGKLMNELFTFHMQMSKLLLEVQYTINPFVTNGISHRYHLDEATFT